MSVMTSLVGLALMIGPAPRPAAWQGAVIGQSFADLSVAYPEARAEGPPRARRLQIEDIDYSGVRWRHVVLAFDLAGRLDHVTFSARGVDFDDLKARLDAHLDAEPLARDGVQTASASVADTEMRICQVDDDDVDVTFERVRYAL